MYLQLPHVPSEHHCVSMCQPAFESSSTRAPQPASLSNPAKLRVSGKASYASMGQHTYAILASKQASDPAWTTPSPPRSPCLSGSRGTSQHTLHSQGRWPPQLELAVDTAIHHYEQSRMPAQDYTNQDDEKTFVLPMRSVRHRKKWWMERRAIWFFFHAIVTPAARYGAGATEIHCRTVDGQIFKPWVWGKNWNETRPQMSMLNSV